MGFAVRFSTGSCKSVVRFALVRGVLHCFELKIVHINMWHLGLEISYFTDRSRTNLGQVKGDIMILMKVVLILHRI